LLRTLIVDDEQPSLNKLEKLLNNSGMAKVAGRFTEPLKALEFLEECKVDAVFLDIEMPDMDGIELAGRIIDLYGDIDVVFVTAYNQYAVEAFRLNALDYLLKPVSADRLSETLNRITKKSGRKLYTNELQVQCFGRFCVSAGEEEIRFRTEKAEELLAFLIDCRGGFVSRSKILDRLWADFDGDRAMVHFNTTLHYVKKALLAYGIQISIHYDRGSYRINLEGLNCDYLKFCDFADNKRIIGQGNILECEEVLELYTGEYLSGWDYEWIAGKRLLLEEKFIEMLLETAAFYKSAGNYSKAGKWLREGLFHVPFHRELNYRLVEILLLMHERELAEKYYNLYRIGLHRKFGLEPDEAFNMLLK